MAVLTMMFIWENLMHQNLIPSQYGIRLAHMEIIIIPIPFGIAMAPMEVNTAHILHLMNTHQIYRY